METASRHLSDIADASYNLAVIVLTTVNVRDIDLVKAKEVYRNNRQPQYIIIDTLLKLINILLCDA